MNTADKARVAIGAGTLVIAVAVTVLAIRAEPPREIDDTPSQEAMRAAVEGGVDISNGSPGQDRDRLLAVFNDGETTPFSEITFRDGLYLEPETNGAFTGYLASAHSSGSPQLVCVVVDGRLQGPSVAFYESGAMRRALNHNDGRPVGQIIEYFEDGSMKLRAMAYGDSDRGGTEVGEITVGTHDGGEYARRGLGTGRIQFIYGDGTCEFTNAKTPLDEVEGWMLFNDPMLRGQVPYTTDSRSVPGPA